MNVELITKEDLQLFRLQLLNDIKALIIPEKAGQVQWLRSNEVRKLLKISAGTLQTLRINGTLHVSKVGSISYYKLEEIEKLLNGS